MDSDLIQGSSRQSTEPEHRTAQTATRFKVSPVMVLLLLGAAVLAISTGLRQSMGLFLGPVLGDLKISASAFSFSIALQSIMWGVSQPFAGLLADRFGSRPVIIGAALTYSAGLALMSLASGSLLLDLGGGVLAGIGVSGTGLGIVMGAVSRAVRPERRSQTVGAVAAAGSLGTILLAPLGQAWIAAYGWRVAALAFAGVASLMALVAIGLNRTTEKGPIAPVHHKDDLPLGEVLRQALRHPGYLAMTAAFFACGFQLMFITTHLPSYLAWCGLPPSVGATALGLIGLCNTGGTYVAGMLGARFRQKRLLAMVYLLRTLSIVVFLLVPVTETSALVFAAAMGSLWLSVAPLVSGIVGNMFGLKYFGTLYGVVFLSHQLGSFFGSLMGGVLFDLTGSYGSAWIALIAVGLAAFTLQWPMDDRSPADRARSLSHGARTASASA